MSAGVKKNQSTKLLNPRMFGVSPRGVKLKPISMDSSTMEESLRTMESSKKTTRLPPSFQKLQMQHSATMMMKKYLDNQGSTSENSNESSRAASSQRISKMSIEPNFPKKQNGKKNKLNVTFEDETKERRKEGRIQLSLSMRSNARQNDVTTPDNKTRTLAPLEKSLNDSQIDSNSIKKGVNSSTYNGEPPSPSFASPVQTIKIFGDTNSSVHSLRAKLCIETLTSGCISAFCELFTLSHREPVLIDPIAETYYAIPQDKLITIKELLVRADEMQRDSDFRGVYEVYKQIADYFESEGDIDTSLYFHSLGQSLVKRSSDILLESVAHENIGKVYDRLGQTENALKSHEAHLSLADASQDSEEASKARKQLWDVYMKIAQDHDAAENYQDACLFYEKSLKVAKSSNEKELIAKSFYYLGRVYERLDNCYASLENQEQYIQLCEELDDMQGRANAQSALGQVYERLNKPQSALTSYKRFLEFAEECKNENLIEEACERIGLVLNQLGEYQESVPYFERQFLLSQNSRDELRIQQARVKLGFAKGNARMMDHLKDMLQRDNFDTKSTPMNPTLPTSNQPE